MEHYSAYILCSYCREVHCHGVDKDGGAGYRVQYCHTSYCDERWVGYILVDPSLRQHVSFSRSPIKDWKLK